MNNMKQVEKKIKVFINDTYEVIVIGGGPAGCAAAIASAREGVKTLLIERTSGLGGMGTMGLVTSWCPFANGEQVVYKGLAEKIFTISKKEIKHIKQTDMNWVVIDPEYQKRVYDDLMIEAGVDVLFHTTLAGAETKEGEVQSIIVSNKKGLTSYQANVFIDTTGDADLVALADGEFKIGDDKYHQVQALTHCFSLSNVDDFGFQHGQWLNKANRNSPAYKIAASDKYDLINDAHMCTKLLGPSTVGFNAGHIDIEDPTDPLQMSRAYMIGRKIASQTKEGLKEFFPEAFGNAYLASTAPLMGVRESRRIVGDYTLTLQDYANRRTFDDEIARNSYFLDIHYPKNNDAYRKEVKELVKDIKGYSNGESHGIPYRCLTPRTLKNVLVAGRSISVEKLVQGSTRVMPVCLVTGEAAGLAGAMAAKGSNDVHKLNVKQLRENLIKHGAYIL